ncbi:MAG: primosomal protein N' [Thiovulaceae bacterium]|nr:primosomal protein N' [Sulfurimonadaceae bacterium]
MPNYYEVAIKGAALDLLTYESDDSIDPYTLVTVKLRGKEKEGYIIRKVEKPTFKTAQIVTIHPLLLSQSAFSIATFIASYYICALGEALALFTPEEINLPALNPIELDPLDLSLSQKQDESFTFIKQHPVSLLFGDTGSGKTEVYIHYFHEVLKQNKTALFLMPEISLTPQMEQRMTKHFGDRVAIWHSKLTKKRKEVIKEGMRDGTIRIIAGPRSILFLPLQNLGLIVVDEEHDDSYKSGQKPRYNARDLAILMGTKQKIPVLLGSATPSISSFQKFPYFRLKGGFYNTKRAITFEAKEESLTPSIIHAMQENFYAKKQSLIFLPTRANFKYLVCQSCGDTVHCPFCSVGMSLHTHSRLVRCHYCNYAEAIPKKCPKCQHPDLSSTRLGTAEVVNQLNELFPQQTIQQFDRDVITTDTGLKKVLKSFNNKEIDTLVGTQMLSKGHDYHDITLGVVLGIDHILNQSDYRAREKALSLLIQIIGRSGRKEAAKIIVQSFNQEFFAAYLDRYEDFLQEELSFREGYYPPFMKLARVLFAHKNEITASEAMTAMETRLKAFENISVVGSGKAAIEKIAGKFRYNILLRSASSKDLLLAIKKTLHPLAQVDIDPIDFV